MKKLILILTFSFASLAHAQDFFPYHWEPGFHLFAGGGVNSALYSSPGDTWDGGLGLNLRTDVVYFLSEGWAIEAGSSVKFNRVDKYLIWDTLFTFGLRFTVPSFTSYQYGQPYGRVFIGRAPTVIFLNGEDAPKQAGDTNASRVQFDGPVGGLAYGTYHQTESGLVWYTEFAGSIQSLEQQNDIDMDGDVPVVTSSGKASEHIMIYSLYLSIGVLAF